MTEQNNNSPITGTASKITKAKYKGYILEKSHAVPFVHKFMTKENKYIFDVNTLKIVQVGPVVWDIIYDVGRISKDEIITKYSNRYNSDDISLAYDAIAEFREKKELFLSRYPEILMPLTDEHIRHRVETSRMELILNVSEACNFRCAYCIYSGLHTGQRTHSNRKMEWPVAQKAIDQYLQHSKEAKSHVIAFYGGEPLLNFALIRKCVDYVRKTNHEDEIGFHISTNASLLNGEIADFLACNRFNITISLDGPKQIHDRYRRHKDGSGTWEEVMLNTRAFLAKYPQYRTNGKVGVNMVLTPTSNLDEIDKFIQSYDMFSGAVNLITLMAVIDSRRETCAALKGKLRRKDVEVFYKNFFENLSNGYINTRPLDCKFILQRKLFEQTFLKLHKRFEIFGNDRSGRPLITKQYCALSTCIPGERRTFVTIDGDYFSCERVTVSSHFKIGNVNEGFDVPQIRRLLEEWVDLSKEECEFCWCLPMCGAGCWSSVNNGTKPTASLKKKHCINWRKQVHRRLIDYCSILEKGPSNLDYIEDITVS
jgi:uncharacterized protein